MPCRRSRRKSDGLPVNAVSGFCNMLWKLLTDARDTSVGVTPTHFAVIFDYSSKTFRNALYDKYKANRSAPPEELIPQFGLIREATRAFNLPCIEKEGFEADDIIATYARMAEATGADVTIVSSDKDLMQLVTANVSMYDSMKDKQISIPEVIEKWGVPPEKMIDMQAMTGDSTDNVPGIPGIGPKTAAQLLEEFGDLDTLLARAGEIKQVKRRENIMANADLARLSRQLVTLKIDTPVDVDLDALHLETQDGPRLIAFLKAMEFTTLTRRVAAATETDADAVEAANVPVEWGAQAHGPDLDKGELAGAPSAPSGLSSATSPARGSAAQAAAVLIDGNASAQTPQAHAQARAESFGTAKIDHAAYVAIRDVATLDAWIAEARDAGLVAFDTETTSLDAMQAELVGFSLAIADNSKDPSGTTIKAAYVPLLHKTGGDDLFSDGVKLAANQIPMHEALPRLKALLEDPAVLKVAQNLKYDYLVMKRHGVTIQGFDDTMLMSYVVDAGNGTHGMDALSERWLGHQPISLQIGDRQRQVLADLRLCRDRQGHRLCRGGCRCDAPALARAETAAGIQGAGFRLRAAGATAGAGSRADGRARHFRRSADPVAAFGRTGAGCRRASRTISMRWPAKPSISARRNSSATSCLAAWGWPAARRPRPDSGRPLRRCWKTWPRKGIRCRARSSTGAS